MYSWKSIRTLSAILLLIPIVHLTFLVSRETLTAMDTSPEVWGSEIEAYTQSDRLITRLVDPIEVVGGRSVTLWQGLENLLNPRPVLMRGLGDATVNDIVFHYERLIGFYQPQLVILLPGNSEFHVRDNKSAEELVSIIREFAELDLMHRKQGRLYIFLPLVTPFYSADKEKIQIVARMLTLWATTNAQVEILDANPLFSDALGSPRADYFRSDGVNLNDLGYMRLSILLLTQIEKDESIAIAARS